MAHACPLALTPDEVTTLDACSHHARHPRQRRRAQAVLGRPPPRQTLNQLAAFFAVRYATVHGWLTAWRDQAWQARLEGQRAGRPPSCPRRPKSERLARPGHPAVAALDSAPAPRFRRASCTISTLRRMARAAGYAWKRCRRSLRSQRDPAAFAACRVPVAGTAPGRGPRRGGRGLRRRMPLRRHEPPCPTPGSAGASPGGDCRPCAAAAALRARLLAGPRPRPAPAGLRAGRGRSTADLFVLAVTDFAPLLDRPTVLVLDNASIHRAHVVRACHAEWAAKGLTLLFLPAYSPELNHIELLWHRYKHYWVRPKTTKSSHLASFSADLDGQVEAIRLICVIGSIWFGKTGCRVRPLQ
ncbi:MAG: transposase [Hymenobacter sp.]